MDFGCVKRLPADFVEHYRQLVYFAAHDDPEAHFQSMINIGMLTEKLPGETVVEIRSLSDEVGKWFGALFAEEQFDFEQMGARIGFRNTYEW